MPRLPDHDPGVLSNKSTALVRLQESQETSRPENWNPEARNGGQEEIGSYEIPQWLEDLQPRS